MYRYLTADGAARSHPAGKLVSVSPPDAIDQFLADRSGCHGTKALRADCIGGGDVESHMVSLLSSDKAGTNGAPRPRTGRNICEVCERALARTDTGMCDFCTVKQQRQAGGVA